LDGPRKTGVPVAVFVTDVDFTARRKDLSGAPAIYIQLFFRTIYPGAFGTDEWRHRRSLTARATA
jgi:hypothetical protein